MLLELFSGYAFISIANIQNESLIPEGLAFMSCALRYLASSSFACAEYIADSYIQKDIEFKLELRCEVYMLDLVISSSCCIGECRSTKLS